MDGKAYGDALAGMIFAFCVVAICVGAVIGIGSSMIWNRYANHRDKCAAMYVNARTERDTLNAVHAGCKLPTTPTRGSDE